MNILIISNIFKLLIILDILGRLDQVTPFVGAGSDHASFLFYAGVPVMDIMFLEDSKLHPNMSGYPAYHTGLETIELVEKIYDPDYKVSPGIIPCLIVVSDVPCLRPAQPAALPGAGGEYCPALQDDPLRQGGWMTRPGGRPECLQVMEEGLEFLETTGVMTRVRDLGIPTSHWEEAVLAFRSPQSDMLQYFISLRQQRGC